MLTWLGSLSLGIATDAGGMALIGGRIVRTCWRRRLDRDELWRCLYSFGNASWPIVAATALFTGLIMVLQAALYVRQFGARDLVGWFAGFAVLRELGPLLIGLMFSGRVGASNTTELATLVATEKLDALRVLGLDVYEILIVPRTISMVVALCSLLIVGNALALLGSTVGAALLLEVEPAQFWRSLITRLSYRDVLLGLDKALIFGLLLAVVSTYYGLAHRGGAVGVGRAVYAQVVASAVCLFAADYGITALLG